MKQSSLLLLSISFLMATTARAQTITPGAELNKTGLPQSTDCFFCNENGEPTTIGSNNPPRKITELTVVGKPKEEGLPSAFEPNDLIDIDPKYITPLFREAYIVEMAAGKKENKMRNDAYLYMTKMLDAAHSKNIDLYIHSAYRSYQIQCQVFSNKLVKQLISHNQLPAGMTLFQLKKDTQSGWKPTYTNEELRTSIDEVNTRSALPGQSEHQLGSVADLVTFIEKYENPEKPFTGYALENEMEETAAFKWLQTNAYKYGYALSYPTMPKFAVTAPNPRTGYIYEPWHWRFIGVKRATDYKYCGNRFVLREYLKQVAINPQFQCVKNPTAVAAPTKKATTTTVKAKTKPPVTKSAPAKKAKTKSWYSRITGH